ncbi:hypothetical protein AQUCO_00100887v1 [Aquilegia coerulea]|uniref:Uncharacterized protein n=1 Tax=Aquilegia coerulea TaxID=218851 RepID=A0A2G5FCI4_AQUCA|nr:hypothetical protein AQUCO_00100887v1 [Aquilegia coerulea]
MRTRSICNHHFKGPTQKYRISVVQSIYKNKSLIGTYKISVHTIEMYHVYEAPIIYISRPRPILPPKPTSIQIFPLIW